MSTGVSYRQRHLMRRQMYVLPRHFKTLEWCRLDDVCQNISCSWATWTGIKYNRQPNSDIGFNANGLVRMLQYLDSSIGRLNKAPVNESKNKKKKKKQPDKQQTSKTDIEQSLHHPYSVARRHQGKALLNCFQQISDDNLLAQNLQYTHTQNTQTHPSLTLLEHTTASSKLAFIISSFGINTLHWRIHFQMDSLPQLERSTES